MCFLEDSQVWESFGSFRCKSLSRVLMFATSRSQDSVHRYAPQMSFLQVNHDAWDLLSATPRYTALTAMKENCDIVPDKGKNEHRLNLASRIMAQ